MFAVKGLQTDLRYFNPHVRAQAIVEILLLISVASLIGFGIAWSWQKEIIIRIKATLNQRTKEKEATLRELMEAKGTLQRAGQTQAQLHHTLTTKLNHATQELDVLTGQLQVVRQELANRPTPNLQRLENESGALRFRIKQLEFQNKEFEEVIRKLKNEMEGKQANGLAPSSGPRHPFVRPAELGEKNDLSQIKGIGPFIEKRLNMLGIYTFRQMSELTPEDIEQVSHAIEFFPNRILRDNWVGQAAALLARL
jgi:predicted flap endonuclease-1-like 5' DNA nuclease